MAVEQIPQPRLFKATGARITPQVEWVEVQVKSVLNRVKGMGFNWSINPYRGCQHQCVFCTSPETPVLMGDGTHKPIVELRPGDTIYGTENRGWYRRYVRTQVLAHWHTRKPAYRITLEDGTELVASGDHRFLTERGWKFVTGTEWGPNQRPFLTVNNKLMGVGAFVDLPQKDSHYRRGYLAGLIRGDGLLASYKYTRTGRRHGNVHQFRLALTDVEALDRAKVYLRGFDVPTYSFVFHHGSPNVRPSQAIRTSSLALVDAVRGLVAWPGMPPLDWWKGFLAGIFDAEGSYARGVMRIATTDPVILDHISRGLNLLGFRHVTETRDDGRQKSVSTVRLRGGLREHLRFFHTVDPAISRKRDIEGQAVKSQARLRIAAIEPLGVEQPLVDITTGTGNFIANGVVSHNCYARRTHWFLDQDGVNDWGTRIFVKINAPQVLRGELAHRSWTREEVQIGTATDPYQPAEGAYKITRQVLEALRDFNTPMGLVTRSTMVIRDLDVLRQLGAGPGARVCFSIATLDETLAREIEPDVPPPLRRLEAMRTVSQAGVPTAVLLAPVLPAITDDVQNLTKVVEAAKEYGASTLWTNALHLGDVTRETFFGYLETRRPELLPEYERLYRGKYAPFQYREQVQKIVATIKSRVGFHSREKPAADQKSAVSKVPVQTQLFSR